MLLILENKTTVQFFCKTKNLSIEPIFPGYCEFNFCSVLIDYTFSYLLRVQNNKDSINFL
jgi:hypothetical protein